jgi:hypothetical protein
VTDRNAAQDGIAVSSIARAGYWASRAISAEAEVFRCLPSLEGDYGTVFEGEDTSDRRPWSARRWSRVYCSLLRALEDELDLGAFGLTTDEAWTREVHAVRARALYWGSVLITMTYTADMWFEAVTRRRCSWQQDVAVKGQRDLALANSVMPVR